MLTHRQSVLFVTSVRRAPGVVTPVATPGARIRNTGENDMSKQTTDPAHSLEAEEALCGALLSDMHQEVMTICNEKALLPIHFHNLGCQAIYQAACDLIANGREITLTTIPLELEARKQVGADGGNYLEFVGGYSQLTQYASDGMLRGMVAEDIELAIQRILDTSGRRRALDMVQVTHQKLMSSNGPGAEVAEGLKELAKELTPATETAPTGSNWAEMNQQIGSLEWVWQDWMLESMLTMIAAASEMGKSIVALRIASCFLTGAPWPDDTPFTGKLGSVLWLEAESAQAINLDRARKWGLPLDRIITPFRDPLADIILADERHKIQIQARAMQPDVRFIVVDSLSGANDRADENSAVMLNIVKWLSELAKNTGKPILLTHHLHKRGILDGDCISLDRVRGSSAIVQTPRVVWALDRPDPATPNNTRMAVIKSNVGRKPKPLGMTIDEYGPHFTNEAPDTPRNETLQDKAADLLKSLLKRGPVAATKIQTEFDGAGISWDAAKRACPKMGIVVARRLGHWEWSLPVEKLL